MIYKLLDKLPNVTNMINCLITRKPLNLDVEIILLLNRKYVIYWLSNKVKFECCDFLDMIITDQIAIATLECSNIQ